MIADSAGRDQGRVASSDAAIAQSVD